MTNAEIKKYFMNREFDSVDFLNQKRGLKKFKEDYEGSRYKKKVVRNNNKYQISL